MQSNDIFKPGTKVRFIIYRDADLDAVSGVLASARYLMNTSPITTKNTDTDVQVKITEVISELNDDENTYDIIGIGVVV